jgi:hypothetical protein
MNANVSLDPVLVAVLGDADRDRLVKGLHRINSRPLRLYPNA